MTQTEQTEPVEQAASLEEAQLLPSDSEGFVPRGTLLFVLLMLLGYALYWAYLWFIVVLERGVGGAI
jgi:hypothetical protein